MPPIRQAQQWSDTPRFDHLQKLREQPGHVEKNTKYQVSFNYHGKVMIYELWATSEGQAKSRAAFRCAQDAKVNVSLVQSYLRDKQVIVKVMS